MKPWMWSDLSVGKLETCAQPLQDVMNLALKTSPVDMKVLQGHRSVDEQLSLYEQGLSKVRVGRHNSSPSEAVDVVPLLKGGGIDWHDRERFFLLAGVIYAAAEQLGVSLRWGGDWDTDTDYRDQTFIDLVHWELKA